eukprot:gene7502-8300_t
MTFSYLKRGANHTCASYNNTLASAKFSSLFEEEGEEEGREEEEEEEKGRQKVRMRDLVQAKKAKADEANKVFQQALTKDILAFYQRILLTIEEANDICKEMNKSILYELDLSLASHSNSHSNSHSSGSLTICPSSLKSS